MLFHKLVSQIGRIVSKNKLSILIYHQVVAQKDPMRPTEPDAREFRWQMQLLQQYFTPLLLKNAVEMLQNGTLPRNAVCVTFDDGYLNNLEVAQPILQELSVPATIYISTGFSHGENMWNDRLIDLISDMSLTKIDLKALNLGEVTFNDLHDRQQLIKQLIPKIKYLAIEKRKQIISTLYSENKIFERTSKMMNQEQILQLSKCDKIEIGAHTVDHPILKTLSESEQQQQVLESKKTLESWIHKKVYGFAYPNGKFGTDYDKLTTNIVANSDFQYAVSTNWGVNVPSTCVYQLNRFTPWDKSKKRFHIRLIKNMLSNNV